jgi:hypothetical protein
LLYRSGGKVDLLMPTDLAKRPAKVGAAALGRGFEG